VPVSGRDASGHIDQHPHGEVRDAVVQYVRCVAHGNAASFGSIQVDRVGPDPDAADRLQLRQARHQVRTRSRGRVGHEHSELAAMRGQKRSRVGFAAKHLGFADLGQQRGKGRRHRPGLQDLVGRCRHGVLRKRRASPIKRCLCSVFILFRQADGAELRTLTRSSKLAAEQWLDPRGPQQGGATAPARLLALEDG
jgi:hypothetical protein